MFYRKKIFHETGFDELPTRIEMGHRILWTVFAFMVLFIIWAYFAEIDEVTRSMGKVVPSQKIQIIQTLDGGIVKDILIEEGGQVRKDQILMRVDSTRFASSYQEGKVKSIVLNLRVQRLKALASETPFDPAIELRKQYPDLVNNEMQLYNSRLNDMHNAMAVLENQKSQKEQELKELSAKAHKLSDSYNLVSQELKMMRPLVKEGAVSEVEILRTERTANEMAGDLKETQLAIPRAQSALNEAINKLKEQKSNQLSQFLKELSENQGEWSALKESNKALEDRVLHTDVRSPVDGTIKKLNVNTVGGVVTPGLELMEIVPQADTLLVEAKVKPADIAFLRPGQDAMVKITAYDFSIYGGLKGKLERIGADTITEKTEREGESYYQITIRTDKNYIEKNGKKHEIIPGMTASVDILTGRKTVLQYILKPIIKAKSDALRER